MPILLLIILFCLTVPLYGQTTISREQLTTLNIPLIDVVTQDSVELTCTCQPAPSGSIPNIIDAIPVGGRMVMTLRNDTLYDSGDYKENYGMTISIRCKTPYEEKKSYDLKLEQKTDLFFREDEALCDKNWTLLRLTSVSNTFIGLYVNQFLEMPWTPQCQVVNVMLNGDYKGLYYLIENVCASKSRLDVNETGFIAEYDRYALKAPFSISSQFDKTVGFTFEYPDADDMTKDWLSGMNHYLSAVQTSMTDGAYNQYVDVTSFAKWLIGQDILGQKDVYGSQAYLMKKDDTDTTLLCMANLWNFDHIMECAGDQLTDYHTRSSFMFPHMKESSDDMMTEYIREWRRLKNKNFSQALQTYLDSITHSELNPDINTSLQYNNQRWNENQFPLDSQIKFAKRWLGKRCTWMDNFISHLRVDSLHLKKLDVVLMQIETIDGVEPTYDVAPSPYGGASSITNAVEVPGRMTMSLGDSVFYDSGEYKEGKQGITMHVRGNSSALISDKKPYHLKLQHKNDLMFRGKEEFRSKHWVLLQEGPMLHIPLGLFVSEQLDMQWTPKSRLVNLVVNGDYRGLYHLIENPRSEDGRIETDDETGFLAEYDCYWWKETVSFSSLYGTNLKYTLKYPDEDDYTFAYLAYIGQTLHQMETSMADGTYPKYVDVPSFAKYLLGQDIIGSYDSRGCQKYFVKYDNTDQTTIHMPCMWDFNDNMSSAQSPTEFVRIHTSNDYCFSYMFNSNQSLMEEYIRQWERLKENQFQRKLTHFLDSVRRAPNRLDVNASILLDRQRWNYTRYMRSIDAYIRYARNWYNERLPWLEDTISRMAETTRVLDISHASWQPQLYYNLQGIPQTTPYHGINIVIDDEGRRRKVYLK